MTAGLLEGVRIVECAAVIAGPSVGKHLGDLGADVVKVEPPGVGDSTRTMGEAMGDRSAWWLVVARNKRSVTLNLKSPAGRDAFLKLIETADVLVESFRPGVLERLDLAPDTLRSRNEQLILLRLSGFGQTGPYSVRPGFGTLAEALSGLAAITGANGGPPLLAPTAIADEIAGLFATWSVLAGLYARDALNADPVTLDVSLYESLFAVMGSLPTQYASNGYTQPRLGSRLPWSAPRNVYETGDGTHFVVSGTTDSAVQAILGLVGGDELAADERFADGAARRTHADELDAIVAEWIAARTGIEVEAAFAEANIPGARVLGMPEIFADAHFAARGTLARVDDPELGEVVMSAPVPRIDGETLPVRHVGPALGEHTDELLRELGYDDDEIERHREEGAW